MTRSARFNNESTNSGTVIFPEGDVAEISGRITMPLGRVGEAFETRQAEPDCVRTRRWVPKTPPSLQLRLDFGPKLIERLHERQQSSFGDIPFAQLGDAAEQFGESRIRACY